MYYYHSGKSSKIFRILVNFLIISVVFETIAIWEYLGNKSESQPAVFVAKDFSYKPLVEITPEKFDLVPQDDLIVLEEKDNIFNTPMLVDHGLYKKVLAKNSSKEISKSQVKIAQTDTAKSRVNDKVEKKAVFKITKLNLHQDVENKEIAYNKIEYQVKKGDTLWTIAKKYGLKPEELAKQNHIALNSTLTPGQKLQIITNEGFIYKVKKGDTLWSIGKTFNINYKVLAFYNNLKSYTLRAGDKLVIPWTKETAEEKYKIYLQNSLAFIWPTKYRRITSPFGYRYHPIYGRKIFHTGIDIGVAYQPVKAALSGVVEYAGWIKGYGKIVILRHKKGYTTRYAHLSRVKVKQGDKVVRGQIIAVSGNSGKTTGPHLHFEVRRYGKLVNPLKVLPKR